MKIEYDEELCGSAWLFCIWWQQEKGSRCLVLFVPIREKPAAGGLFLVPVFLVNLILQQVYAFSDVLHLAQI